MLRRALALALMLAISVSAFASHCEDFHHLTEHLAAFGQPAAGPLVLTSPTNDHEEPCDHCAFCTGGIELDSPTVLPTLAIHHHRATTTPTSTQSLAHPPACQPPRV